MGPERHAKDPSSCSPQHRLAAHPEPRPRPCHPERGCRVDREARRAVALSAAKGLREAMLLEPLPMGEVAPSDGAGVGPYSARLARFRNSALRTASLLFDELSRRRESFFLFAAFESDIQGWSRSYRDLVRAFRKFDSSVCPSSILRRGGSRTARLKSLMQPYLFPRRASAISSACRLNR
jgi:hypothetical protein